MVRKFAETEIKPVAAELDHTHRHPEEICRKLGEMGIMGVSVPTEYGGAGMDNVTYVMAMIEISKACASCGVIVSVNNTLYGHPVKTFGTHEQKLKFLTPVAGGLVEGCYGLTEAGAGSDAAALRCKAELKATSISSTVPRCLSPTALSHATAFWRQPLTQRWVTKASSI